MSPTTIAAVAASFGPLLLRCSNRAHHFGSPARAASLLQARRDWTAPTLAERLEVSQRTVRRDVELPPLLLDDDQAVAVALALQTAPASVSGLDEAAIRALAVLQQVMPSRLRHRADAVAVTSVPPSRPVATAEPDVVLALSAAVRAREAQRFGHITGDVEQHRRVEPHHVVTWSGRWYLVPWDLDRDDWRTFRADRIRPRWPTVPRFTPREIPGGDVAAWITVRLGRFDHPEPWPVRGEVVLRVPAPTIVDRVRGSVVEPLDGDRCRVVLGSWSWVGLAATVALFDAEIELAEPAELRAAFGVLARRATSAAT